MENLILAIGTSEFLLIALVVLLLFGGKKLPEMMKGLGQGIKSFKEGMNEAAPNEKSKEEESIENKENSDSNKDSDTSHSDNVQE